jgi:pyruvate,water dikinase
MAPINTNSYAIWLESNKTMPPSTGLSSLDKILHGIMPGDNIVWQVDSIDDYTPFVEPFCAYAQVHGKKLVYFRFAGHKELIDRDLGAEVCQLNPKAGFEPFINTIHDVIKQTGRDAYYVFDSLSELALDCYSERMVGNFFMLTCPYLYRLEDIAYFVVLRNYHSYHAALPISETTQILLNVYQHQDQRYIHPLKVHERHSSTMNMLHLWHKDDFVPVTQSSVISDILASTPWPGLQSASYRMIGMWDRRFIQAEEILASYHQGECSGETVEKVYRRQLEQIISSEERILNLAEKYFDLPDIINIWKHLIGSGMVGGKTVGMLLGRAILEKADSRWAMLLESHDSFFIGSDIFYSFLVQNGCWEIRRNQRNPATLFDGIEEARQRILQGKFPDYIINRFSDMLDYFGQSPIIVRSSSLLEDNFGNAFAGKYESVFCVNQGTRQHRLDEFLNAIRFIYASTMSDKALTYRAERGVLGLDEQMCLLVQRVSGAPNGNFFFPQLAGVGLSYNPYVWDKSIDPEAGMLRLVFGLGTRAVNRSDDDYTRIVALNVPARHPEAGFDAMAKYAQKRVDVLDLKENRLTSGYFVDIARQSTQLQAEMFATCDKEQLRQAQNRGIAGIRPWVINFDRIFSRTDFIKDMREMLDTLKQAYGCHLDIEFTVNFLHDGAYKINLLQCRPLQIKAGTVVTKPVPHIDKENLILEAHGGIVGVSRILALDRIIYVVPSVYGELSEKDRYAVARLIGQLTHLEGPDKATNIMLIGPGRWGTSTPSLGVPVSFAEINTVSVVCEIESMREGLTPDLSLGTHFFNDLVERNMLYIGFFRNKKENLLNENFLEHSPNNLEKYLPKESSWSQAVRIIDATEDQKIFLSASNQVVKIYLGSKTP